MKKILLFISIVLANSVTVCYGQVPLIKNSNGQISDGNFSIGCNPTAISNCSGVSVSCSNWESANAPMVINYGCIGISPQNLGNSFPNFCLLRNNHQYIRGSLVDLIPGQNYQLSFYQTMLFDNFIGPYQACSPEESPEGQSIGYFRVLLDNEPFESPDISCERKDGGIQVEQVVFSFTVPNNTTVIPFQINPQVVLNQNPNFTLGISTIRISCTSCPSEPEEPEGPDYNPIDEVVVSNPCEDCTSFELLRGEEYVISAWVKRTDEIDNNLQLPTFNNNNSETENVFLRVGFASSNNEYYNFFSSGNIIEGWQRINGTFYVPVSANEISIQLKNLTNGNAYFDDIRIHPVNSNLKSFVYDQYTQRLMAELDENNYSTFYEYDKEGGLVRVKKETERGVFSIQETRSSTIKR